jgi:hypothetical protein
MVNVTKTAQALAEDYTNMGSYIGLATGDPGSTATPMNEASGGSPAYARQPTNWGAGTGGVYNGTPVTINVKGGGLTYNYMILCSGATGNNMVDNCPIPPQVMTADGPITVTPVYTQS